MAERKPLVLSDTGSIEQLQPNEPIASYHTNRVFSIATISSLTPEKNSYDVFEITALDTDLTLNNPTNIYKNFDKIEIRIIDNGTARAITFGDKYIKSNSVDLPTSTTVGITLRLGFEFDGTNWVLLARDG